MEHDWTQTPRKEGTFVLDSTTNDSGDGVHHDSVHTVQSRTSTPAASRPSSTRSHG